LTHAGANAFTLIGQGPSKTIPTRRRGKANPLTVRGLLQSGVLPENDFESHSPSQILRGGDTGGAKMDSGNDGKTKPEGRGQDIARCLGK